MVKKTLPSITKEVEAYGKAKLIIHDSTEGRHGREEKWDFLTKLQNDHDIFLIKTTNLSMGLARNLCLLLSYNIFVPDYICMVEDDHGFKTSLISSVVDAMKLYYGRRSPNGLRYGVFSCCLDHTNADIKSLTKKYSYPSLKSSIYSIGGYNSCFRCAPAQHWQSVLIRYDQDEYLISNFQTANLIKEYFKFNI
jgi:hypothetical protein